MILFVGLAAAARIDQAARQAQQAAGDQSPDVLAAAALTPGDSKRYGYQVGQLTGNVGVLLDHASQLGYGRPLAVVVALVSFAAAGALLVVADKV